VGYNVYGPQSREDLFFFCSDVLYPANAGNLLKVEENRMRSLRVRLCAFATSVSSLQRMPAKRNRLYSGRFLAVINQHRLRIAMV